MIVKVYITLKPGVLDPQGQAVRQSLGRLGYHEVHDVRVGKYIELSVDDRAPEPRARVEAMCRDLLTNQVIEDFRVELPPSAAPAAKAR
jgi:phosphoribosylformylglycinamidine synthase